MALPKLGRFKVIFRDKEVRIIDEAYPYVQAGGVVVFYDKDDNQLFGFAVDDISYYQRIEDATAEGAVE